VGGFASTMGGLKPSAPRCKARGLMAWLVAACCAAPHTAWGAPPPAGVWSAAPAMAAIDLNQATRAEIESVRAVGVELTERLLQARSAGPFVDWQDLRQRVKGVSRKALEGFAEAGFQIKGQAPPTRP
jgi:hypothetical protein